MLHAMRDRGRELIHAMRDRGREEMVHAMRDRDREMTHDMIGHETQVCFIAREEMVSAYSFRSAGS